MYSVSAKKQKQLRAMAGKEIKVVCVGDNGVGKTSLLLQHPLATQSPADEKKVSLLTPKKNKVDFNGTEIVLNLVDTTPQQSTGEYEKNIYPGADAVIVFFSISDPKSFAKVESYWVPQIKTNCPEAALVFVGTKKDLREDPSTLERLKKDDLQPVTHAQGSEMALKLIGEGGIYIECSVNQGLNVHNVIEQAIYAAIFSSKSKKSKLGSFFGKKKERSKQGKTNKAINKGDNSIGSPENVINRDGKGVHSYGVETLYLGHQYGKHLIAGNFEAAHLSSMRDTLEKPVNYLLDPTQTVDDKLIRVHIDDFVRFMSSYLSPARFHRWIEFVLNESLVQCDTVVQIEQAFAVRHLLSSLIAFEARREGFGKKDFLRLASGDETQPWSANRFLMDLNIPSVLLAHLKKIVTEKSPLLSKEDMNQTVFKLLVRDILRPLLEFEIENKVPTVEKATEKLQPRKQFKEKLQQILDCNDDAVIKLVSEKIEQYDQVLELKDFTEQDAKDKESSLNRHIEDMLDFRKKQGSFNTALRDAVKNGQAHRTKALCQLGVDINDINKDGTSVLLDAVFANQSKVVSILCQCYPTEAHHGQGIYLEYPMGSSKWYGYTAIHIAAELGYTEVALALIQAGADPHAKVFKNVERRTKGNKTAISIAKSKSNTKMLDVLQGKVQPLEETTVSDVSLSSAETDAVTTELAALNTGEKAEQYTSTSPLTATASEKEVEALPQAAVTTAEASESLGGDNADVSVASQTTELQDNKSVSKDSEETDLNRVIDAAFDSFPGSTPS